jgi:protein tyrosine phosphatase
MTTEIGLKFALKNRYNNVFPYDDNIVSLPSNAYINASWITDDYIITQAPIPSSIGDFWEMIEVWKVPIIVMLTDYYENGHLKAHPYLPYEGQPLVFGDLHIRKLPNEKEEDIFGVTRKTFEVKCVGQSPHIVEHIHYREWKDSTSPSSGTTLLSIIESVNPTKYPKNPIVVHCSAG